MSLLRLRLGPLPYVPDFSRASPLRYFPSKNVSSFRAVLLSQFKFNNPPQRRTANLMIAIFIVMQLDGGYLDRNTLRSRPGSVVKYV